MNKRHVLLLTAVLGMAALPVLAQSSAPTDAQLRTDKITVETGTYTGPLSSLLAAIAKTAGYGLILDTDVDLQQTPATTPTSGAATPAPTGRPVVYSFKDKPFNEVWPLLMDVYGLSYEVIQVGGQPVLRVGNAPIQRIVNLKNADAKTVVEQVSRLFGEPIVQDNPQRDASGNVVGFNKQIVGYKFNSPSLKIVGDDKTNSIVVIGTNKEVIDVINAIQNVDVQERTVSGSKTYIANKDTASVVKFIESTAPDIKVTTFSGTNKIFLEGPEKRLSYIDGLLNQFDLAEIATKENDPSLIQTVRIVYTAKSGAANANNLTAVLSSQFPRVRFTPLAGTANIILNGTQSDIKEAQSLLAQIDIAPATAPTTVQRVFQLVNASAEEVKATLEGTLQKEVTSTAQRGTGTTLLDVNGNPISALVPPSQQASADAQGLKTTDLSGTTPTTAPDMPNIIADKRTNTIIVRGTPLQVDQVAELIPQLDKVVPQINVQVRIQELTDSATRSLGLNANLNFGGFSIGTSSGTGLAATFDPTKTLMGFNIFPTLTALETQNLARRVYDGNVTMQSGQRALGGTSQTENASSTAAASVKSGGSLEINIPSQAANIPSIQKTIDYGVILDFFSPQVAPDGTITVRVRGKVNTPPANITANNIPYVLNFQNSEAQSLVSFKSGETLLLAGLMGNTAANGSTGIPYLSKFGIGGTTTKDSKFSQLLVIITGTIVK
ncbi:secretin N-terminal domain-containing protein [Deinococcus fonticola]|uniref:secretin N-terminal domain-containing protein n=1 Tax=Deinococcus fonticola TaxID=2528713 RepID=UPI001075235E|nr:secretin N-terminal domain-containing protein [Deinococcus fonticola]